MFSLCSRQFNSAGESHEKGQRVAAWRTKEEEEEEEKRRRGKTGPFNRRGRTRTPRRVGKKINIPSHKHYLSLPFPSPPSTLPPSGVQKTKAGCEVSP
ncbi:hypothetical protein E2C01_075471 [Portunus trituberculatus]|uniref:Uncharacterized protein n=1 Tax=Portunus trituberculatus TaxID=210409 RepID=A0A5B7IF53_PORTR|nr:hypothetical protein [Portunus trituberculatus]